MPALLEVRVALETLKRIILSVLQTLKLTNPQVIGFGISDHETFSQATQYAKGAIIGSAFINYVTAHGVDDLGAFTEPLLNG